MLNKDKIKPSQIEIFNIDDNDNPCFQFETGVIIDNLNLYYVKRKLFTAVLIHF